MREEEEEEEEEEVVVVVVVVVVGGVMHKGRVLAEDRDLSSFGRARLVKSAVVLLENLIWERTTTLAAAAVMRDGKEHVISHPGFNCLKACTNDVGALGMPSAWRMRRFPVSVSVNESRQHGGLQRISQAVLKKRSSASLVRKGFDQEAALYQRDSPIHYSSYASL